MVALIIAAVFLGVITLILSVLAVYKWIESVKAEAISSNKCLVYVHTGESVKPYKGILAYTKTEVVTEDDKGRRKTESGGYIYEYNYRGEQLEVFVPADYAWSWTSGRRRIRLACAGDYVASPWETDKAAFQTSAKAITMVNRSRIANNIVASVTGNGINVKAMVMVAGIVLFIAVAGVIAFNVMQNKQTANAQNQIQVTPPPQNGSGITIVGGN